MILKQVKDKWLNEFTNQLETGERKEINNTFNYYFSQYKKAIDLFLSQNQVNGFDSLFSLKDLNNIYLSTYVNIGMRFAEWYAKNHETLLIKVDTSIYRDNWERRFANIANQVAGERIVSVQGTARETLNKILKKYMADPEFMALNEREGQRILRSKFKQISKYQAQRIIRTEATNAANSGTLQSATDIFGKEQLQKKWISGIDERTRSAHAIANGQIVDFNKKFNVGGQMLNHAGDPAGSAANVVNCRCTVAPFPKPEAQAISEISNIGITPPFAPRIPIPRKPSRVPNPIRVSTPQVSQITERPQFYPDELDAFRKQGYLIDEKMEITKLLKKPISIKFSKKGSSALGNNININAIRHKKGSQSINRVLNHEIGHIVHKQQKWVAQGFGRPLLDNDVKNLFEKLQKKLGLLDNRAMQLEKLKPYNILTHPKQTIRFPNYDKVKIYNDYAINLKKKFPNMDGNEFAENWGAVQDFFGALTKNKVGFGHPLSYYNQRGLYSQYAEFMAHNFENFYTGNPIFKKLYPEIYKETKDLIKKLINKTL